MERERRGGHHFATMMYTTLGCSVLLGGGLLVAVVLGIAVIWKLIFGH